MCGSLLGQLPAPTLPPSGSSGGLRVSGVWAEDCELHYNHCTVIIGRRISCCCKQISSHSHLLFA